MSRYLRALARVLAVLAAAGVVGLSLFAVMQLVVHPLMGPPRRQRAEAGSQAQAPRADEDDDDDSLVPPVPTLRTLLRVAVDTVPFAVATGIVIFVQWVVMRKPPKIFSRR